MWGAFFGAILGGISSYSSQRSADKTAARRMEFDREAIGLSGDEQRQTLQYSAELEDYYRLKQRDEKKKGLLGYSQFGRKQYDNMPEYEFQNPEAPSWEKYKDKDKNNG